MFNFNASDYINGGIAYTFYASQSALCDIAISGVPNPSQKAIDELIHLVATFVITVATKFIYSAARRKAKKIIHSQTTTKK
jgi:hypothetical protein